MSSKKLDAAIDALVDALAELPEQDRPNAMFLEIERAAQQELISIADFVRAALLEKLKRELNKNKN